ncbi:MAG: mycofactocin precursor [Deltaproteobacteria bacterium]|jgi:mycofactocin precursor|nr:mycofactocin precursor [Deltaproteobacteria bacterium]MBT4639149.1 mycofactocin precursor [Deltaproteobacteria bacterium]MBT6500510.1 mycofactocin precursor [Deltaproteobacteria bacterium]MBT7712745.1 mycofactocin precursor [Deltaproteobacteria bacterium]MBT7893331.1 mycofactocin precursor [Deltaproteobacteria bacterium]
MKNHEVNETLKLNENDETPVDETGDDDRYEIEEIEIEELAIDGICGVY